VRARGHDGLPTFGVGREWDRRQWQAIFRQMMGHDLVRPDPDRHGALRMTEAARPSCAARRRSPCAATRSAPPRARPVAQALVSDEDAPLLSALKAKRRALAEAARVPAYVIFPDRTLIEMAETRPQSLDEMARIGGVSAPPSSNATARPSSPVITGEAAAHPSRPPQARGARGGRHL
jgi:ATP-dependent DNA helicase RecQ